MDTNNMDTNLKDVDMDEMFNKLKEKGLSDKTLNKIFDININSNLNNFEFNPYNVDNFFKVSAFVACLDSFNFIDNVERLVHIIQTLKEEFYIETSFLAELSKVDNSKIVNFIETQIMEDRKDLFNLSMVVMLCNTLVAQYYKVKDVYVN